MLHPFKIRASQAGTIMSNPKKGVTGLSEKAKSYCQQWYIEHLYDRPKSFSSKYTAKGNAVEDDAIEYASQRLDWGMVYKNQNLYADADLIGTPDLVLPDLIPDIKSSWDCFTFPLLETELPNPDYYWQLQTYMALCDKQNGMIVYCLMDAPEFLVEREVWSELRSQGIAEYDMDIHDKFKARMTYSHLPSSLRIKTFEVKRNDADIAALRERVGMCREYIASLTVPSNRKEAA